MSSLIFASLASTIPVACLLGIGLAMDSFGISITHGFKDKKIPLRRTFAIAGTFGLFQGIMPLIGWLIVYGLSSVSNSKFQQIFSQIVPPLAFIILAYLGIKMIYEKVHTNDDEESTNNSTKSFAVLLLLQGIATSIDALSTGLAFKDYSPAQALISIAFIMVITFGLCFVGVFLGKKFGGKVGDKAEIIGGAILITVGLFILIKGEIAVNAPHIIPEWLSWLF